MAARGTATFFTVTDPAYPASNYTHPTPVAHAFSAVTYFTAIDPAYPASTYVHPAPVAHAFPAATAVYYGPW